MSHQPLMPHALLEGVYTLSLWNKQLEIARYHLMKATKRMKKGDDKRRHPSDYRQVSKGLLRLYEGSYEVLAKVGKVDYKLALPANMKIHLVVYLSMLTPYLIDPEETSHWESHRAPPLVFQSFDRGIKEILVTRW
ncbi:hypothetical protein V2J09_017682 [Rumex salicifolius]